MGKKLFLEVEQEQAHTGTVNRVTGHQLRVRKTLIDVLVDDVRFVQDQITFDQNRDLAVRIHHVDVFGLVVEVHVTDFEIHAFFEQHKAATMGKRASGSGIKHHHGKGSSKNQKEWKARRPATPQDPAMLPGEQSIT
jgi:hypothetical protein